MSRVIPGILMALGCIALLIWGSTALVRCILLIVGAIGLKEYFRMACPYLSRRYFLLSIAIGLVPLACIFTGSMEAVLAGLVATFMCTVFLCLNRYDIFPDVFSYIATSCFGALYVSVGLSFLAIIHQMDNGYAWLLLLFAVTAASDTGAYYVGKTFGNKKLLPKVSPKKTIAGGVGGICSGILAAILVSLLLPVPDQVLLLLPAAGFLVIMGMVGDLAESMIKRACKIKDSGTILGGHGGLLDRIDGFLLAGPALYYLLSWGILQ